MKSQIRSGISSYFLFTITFLNFLNPLASAQEKIHISDGHEATPEFLTSPPVNAPGYPDRSSTLDVLPGFIDPPDGYGPVPIYLWTGDKLTKERLAWQLETLKQGGIQGVTVFYNPLHPLFNPPRTNPGDPPVFSREWWDIWDFFIAECTRLGMGVGMLDYTLTWPGSGYWVDQIRDEPEFRKYRGWVDVRKVTDLKPGQHFERKIDSDSLVSIFAYPGNNEIFQVSKATDLLSKADNGKVQWNAPEGTIWQVFETVSRSGNLHMLHPEHGNQWVERYFKQFEKRNLSTGNKASLNYFFQDELPLPGPSIHWTQSYMPPGTWSEDFPEQFKLRKGYDILPYLPALTMDIGPVTPKIRLDYYDVSMDLAEERFWKPIFNWHWNKGLIYGVDNHGRGYKPTAYGDYFRALRWFTAPGNDAPTTGTSFIPTKVASSVANLYERPRVWLEAFHSIGWGVTPEQMMQRIDRHYLFGGNVLNLHALYYSLHGGWWEWAPPCFHFRMPYWPHFKYLMKYVERLSYLLSQGRHVADVALMYPVSPVQVNSEHKPDTAFEAGTELFNAGIDFTFMDYQSLARANVENGKLCVSGSEFKVLVLADLPSVRFTTLTRALDFYRSGGIVLATGALASASDRIGSDDPEVDKIISEIFGMTAAEALNGHTANPRRNNAGGMGFHCISTSDLVTVLSNKLERDFISPSGEGKVLHRRTGFRDVYMVMDVPGGDVCFFRSKGKAELWDAMEGTVKELSVVSQTSSGTFLRIPNGSPRSNLIVFSPGDAILEKNIENGGFLVSKTLYETLNLNESWDSELVPTMDNQWGDFRIPATKEIIGAEAHELYYITKDHSSDNWSISDSSGREFQTLVRTSFGPQMHHLIINNDADFNELIMAAVNSDPHGTQEVEINGSGYSWIPYWFSWRWGVLNEPGTQGTFGLKEIVDNRFIILDSAAYHIFKTSITIPKEVIARVQTEGIEPDTILVDGRMIEGDVVRLSGGTHSVVFAYRNTPSGVLQEGLHILDSRARSAVVFVDTLAGSRTVPDQDLSMKWNQHPGLLPFDYYGNNSQDGYYSFLAPPGLSEMSFIAYGKSEVRVNGRPVNIHSKKKSSSGKAIEYGIKVKSPQTLPVWVDIRIKNIPGYYGGAAFAEPVKLLTSNGIINAGNWSEIGVLAHYSGGIRYKQTIDLSAKQTEGSLLLDLGEVAVTCELHVNSKPAGVLVNSPFIADISPYVKEGQNYIEVLVYNTLANHYQTTPSPFKGNPRSGLIGPVRIKIYPAEN